jgi:4-hydroxy-tetrahydrodipicolinate reductase
MTSLEEPQRVVQWGTGNTGAHALRFLLEDPAFEVVGVWVAREHHVGKGAGELAGISDTGPVATSDEGAIIGLEADCVVYMAAEPHESPARPGTDGSRSVDSICRLLESGKNVLSTGISGLVNPTIYGTGVYDRLCRAAERGNTTFFGTGIEPGFMSDALALTLTSVSRNIRSVRTQEIISYATYDQPSYHVSKGGIWGAPSDSVYAESFGKRILAAGMGAPVRLLADVLRVDLDDVTAVVDFARSPEHFEIAMGSIGRGTIAGYRFQVLGLVGGNPTIAVEHVTRVRDDVAPEWPTLEPGGFRVQIDGAPSYTVEVKFDEDDPNVGGCTATAARAVNAIPVVCAAPTGVVSFLDLPTICAAGAVRGKASAAE